MSPFLLAKQDPNAALLAANNALENNIVHHHYGLTPEQMDEQNKEDARTAHKIVSTESPHLVELNQMFHKGVDQVFDAQDRLYNLFPCLKYMPSPGAQLMRHMREPMHVGTDLVVPKTYFGGALIVGGAVAKAPAALAKVPGLLQKAAPFMRKGVQHLEGFAARLWAKPNRGLQAMDLAKIDNVALLNAPKMAKHHIFPQQFRKFFEMRNINIDDFTVLITQQTHLKGLHGKGLGGLPGNWNKRWLAFVKEKPDATAKEIFQYGGQLMDEYRLSNISLQRHSK